jgi:preprotein translocase subunit SecE
VAERKRRDGKADSGRRAGATSGTPRDDIDEDGVAAVDVADEDVVDEADTDADAIADDLDSDSDDQDDADEKSAAKAQKKSDKGKSKGKDKSKASSGAAPVGGIFMRFVNFFREVVAELRKVIWPTRPELLTYTTVVVVFVSLMLTIVGLLDVGFGKAVMAVFSTSTPKAK